ncbi:hypothetical protein D8M05_12735 [Oceanobacillus bengalensis]|uniref:Uncharacterized protein n=2 Tax=Oceanobacillus bengalensis TaxID=1435466 RepID=A0A494YWM9_9BACI|nr:hypothetical protein D8M05_12735 [Oceanobacillus bengalensis]
MYLYMPFLYFPQDKSEYLPAVLSLIFFMALACIALYLFYKKSKKDEKAFDEEYEKKIKQATSSKGNSDK